MRTIGFSILPWCAACAHWEWAVCATSAATPIASASQYGVGFCFENALARLASSTRAVGSTRAVDRSTTLAVLEGEVSEETKSWKSGQGQNKASYEAILFGESTGYGELLHIPRRQNYR
jgi:hypothetical protein